MALDVGGWQTAGQYGGQVSATTGMFYGSLGLFQNDDTLAHDGKYSYAYVALAPLSLRSTKRAAFCTSVWITHTATIAKLLQSVKTSMDVKNPDAITLGTNATAKNDNAFMVEAAL